MLDNGRYIRPDDAARTAQSGVSLNVHEHTATFVADRDCDGQALTGWHRYRLHFDHPRAPYFGGRWSLTAYALSGDPVEPTADGFALGSHDGLRPNADGSVDLRIQCDPPAAPLALNWVECPLGDFRLVLRAYWPLQTLLDGVWRPPVVRRLHEDVRSCAFRIATASDLSPSTQGAFA